MCDPVTGTLVASSLLGAYSSVQQGRSAKAVARYNAREAENEAVRVRSKGTEEENRHRQRVAQLQSRQRAQLGASGVDLESGSALAIQEDTELFGEVDALRIRSNFADQAQALDRGAGLTRQQGRSASRAGNLQAVGSLIGAAGSIAGAGVASKWYSPNSAALTTTTTGSQANAFVGAIA